MKSNIDNRLWRALGAGISTFCAIGLFQDPMRYKVLDTFGLFIGLMLVIAFWNK